jgi:hypothetical protein
MKESLKNSKMMVLSLRKMPGKAKKETKKQKRRIGNTQSVTMMKNQVKKRKLLLQRSQLRKKNLLHNLQLLRKERERP